MPLHETPASPAAAAALADRLLHQGEPVLAYNAAQSGLQQWPGDLRLRQLQGLALARSGDVERANALLEALAEEGGADVETLGMLARTHKDLALGAKDPARRASHLAAGFALYARAFAEARADNAAGAFYAGINAATMAVLSGDLGQARHIAGEVREVCARNGSGNEDAVARYWKEATLGEAALILGEADTAAAHYSGAMALAERHYGNLGSTRKQARLLVEHLPGDLAEVTKALRIPPVLAFTGHMIDAPDRAAPRFPAAIEKAVGERVRSRLAAIAPLAVYGSAACGADLLCLEAARELGAETHIVLPFPPAAFRQASVDWADADWGARFERALAEADSVTVASDHRASGSAATYEYANLILTGMGVLRAQLLDTDFRVLALSDPGAVGAAGGAGSLVSLWDARGLAVEHIDLAALRGKTASSPVVEDSPPAGAVPAVRHEMRALLFADAVGYSQLHEDQIPRFIEGFLGSVAELNRRTAHRFEHVETSGDGLYMVFATVADAGRYALELSALVREFDRASCGLPPGFDVRIALHCGPVHCAVDPVTGRAMYTGPHTSRAARIEPVTPPGQVYGSSAFAAVAAAGGAPGLALRYVGRIPLAKGYGTLGLYSVRPADG